MPPEPPSDNPWSGQWEYDNATPIDPQEFDRMANAAMAAIWFLRDGLNESRLLHVAEARREGFLDLQLHLHVEVDGEELEQIIDHLEALLVAAKGHL